ncbi:MAG TPA: hypothetical protein VGD99_20160 [Anaerolineae bacterium]|jgi:hypothetical protein
MLQKLSVILTELFNTPKARVVFILATLVVAVLVGGAPNDGGGGGG